MKRFFRTDETFPPQRGSRLAFLALIRAIIQEMATIHISAADAVKQFDAMLARIQVGERYVIEKESLPVAVVAAPEPKGRLISEVISAFKEREAAMDEIPVLDAGLAEAVEERIRSRRPRDLSRWG